MDVFPGLKQVPITFNFFLFAHADPIQNTDPSGDCVPWLNGIRVHQRIGQDFENGITRFSNKSISTLIGSNGSLVKKVLDGLLRRPDLIDVATREVYEIKTQAGVQDGVAQIRDYLDTLNTFDPPIGSKKAWTAGASYSPVHLNPIIGFPASCVNNATPPIHGVIAYTYGNPKLHQAAQQASLWTLSALAAYGMYKSLQGVITIKAGSPAFAY